MAAPSSVTVPSGFLAHSLTLAVPAASSRAVTSPPTVMRSPGKVTARKRAESRTIRCGPPAQSATSEPKKAIDSIPCAITDGKPPSLAKGSS